MIRSRLILPLLAVPLLQACVYLPQTTTVYDEKCDVYTKEMSLRLATAEIGNLGGCNGKECAYLLAAIGAVAVGSAVISGSIVLVGNHVYWLEKQASCQINPQVARALGDTLRSLQGRSSWHKSTQRSQSSRRYSPAAPRWVSSP